ncbi:MAG: CDP-diacylglycerol--glycerol-3-phosphate 3-phosphatidyltransferase [Gammaproteobacteria bacterium]
MSIPNILTFARILIIPFFLVVYYLPFQGANIVTAILFAIACLTDWLDGYLARKLEQSSRLGAFLDPVADKLLVSVALVLLVGDYGTIWVTLPAAIIVSREIAISALREWMAEMGNRISVRVSNLAKVKTFFQMLSIILLLSQPVSLTSIIVILGLVLMYIAVGLTLWSMYSYLQAAWQEIKKGA